MPQDTTLTTDTLSQSINVPTWEVTLLISGPIKLRAPIRLSEPKNSSRRDLYYSDVSLRDTSAGTRVSVEARAQMAPLARRSALVFIGQMLDVLAFRVNLPLSVSLVGRQAGSMEGHTERRIIEEPEWHSAFEESRLLSFAEPRFLRALGWYRKGLYTEDPFDRFLAFWNSVEVVASGYCAKNEQTKKGIINQIWDCFARLWGDCSNWPIVKGDKEWINSNYETRVDIAHGIAAVTAQEIDDVNSKIGNMKQTAHAFLTGWRETQLHPTVPEELLEKFGQFG